MGIVAMHFDERLAVLLQQWREKADEYQDVANDPAELPLQRAKMTTRASVFRCCAEELEVVMDEWDMSGTVPSQEDR